MTGFHEYTPQWHHTAFEINLHNVRGNECCMRQVSTLCAAKLIGLDSSRNLAPGYATGPNFAGEICSRVLRYFNSGRWSKLFRGSPYYAVK